MAEPGAGWNISCVQKFSETTVAALYILSELPQQSPLELLDSPELCSASTVSCSIRSPAA